MRQKGSWATATPTERGRAVRASLEACLGNKEELAKLFNLTPHGVEEILKGDDWRPTYELGWSGKMIGQFMERGVSDSAQNRKQEQKWPLRNK